MRKFGHILGIVLMTALCVLFAIGAYVLFKYDFKVAYEYAALLKAASTITAISSCSFLLFIAYKVSYKTKSLVKIVLTLIYLVLCAIILYFSFYNQQKWFTSDFEYGGNEAPYSKILASKLIGLIIYGIFVLEAIGFVIYYPLISRRKNFAILIDMISTFIMFTFIPMVILIIASNIYYATLEKVYNAIPTGGGSGGRSREYHYSNKYGCDSTAYSDDGKTFYDEHGAVLGTSDDGGKTFHEE